MKQSGRYNKTAVKAVFNDGSKIVCQVTDTQDIYISNGYVILNMTQEEYNDILFPVFKKEAGNWVMVSINRKKRTFSERTDSDLDPAKRLNSYTLSATGGAEKSPLTMTVSHKSTAVSFYSREQDRVSVLDKKFMDILANTNCFRQGRKYGEIVALDSSARPYALILPFLIQENGSGKQDILGRLTRLCFNDNAAERETTADEQKAEPEATEKEIAEQKSKLAAAEKELQAARRSLAKLAEERDAFRAQLDMTENICQNLREQNAALTEQLAAERNALRKEPVEQAENSPVIDADASEGINARPEQNVENTAENVDDMAFVTRAEFECLLARVAALETGHDPERETEPKAADRPEHKTEPKAADKPEHKTEPKAADKPERETEPKAADKPERKTEPKTADRPERKTKPKTADRPERKTEPKAADRPERETEPKAADRPERETETKAADKPERETEDKMSPQDRARTYAGEIERLGYQAKIKGIQTDKPVVWVIGDADAKNEALKALGGQWARVKKAWYFRAA